MGNDEGPIGATGEGGAAVLTGGTRGDAGGAAPTRAAGVLHLSGGWSGDAEVVGLPGESEGDEEAGAFGLDPISGVDGRVGEMIIFSTHIAKRSRKISNAI